MRDERGFTPSTVEQWSRTTTRFLRWCTQTDRQLGELTAGDIDNYIASQGKGRWKRISTANTVSALRAFLRFAAKESLCSNRLAESISRPRLYQQESLPYAPDWSVVQQMLADVDTDKPRDVRDRVILRLLALYGRHRAVRVRGLTGAVPQSVTNGDDGTLNVRLCSLSRRRLAALPPS